MTVIRSECSRDYMGAVTSTAIGSEFALRPDDVIVDIPLKCGATCGGTGQYRRGLGARRTCVSFANANSLTQLGEWHLPARYAQNTQADIYEVSHVLSRVTLSFCPHVHVLKYISSPPTTAFGDRLLSREKMVSILHNGESIPLSECLGPIERGCQGPRPRPSI